MSTYGPPRKRKGKCNARLYIGDDYGDSNATIQCQLKPEHAGHHLEHFKHNSSGTVIIQWEKDEDAKIRGADPDELQADLERDAGEGRVFDDVEDAIAWLNNDNS